MDKTYTINGQSKTFAELTQAEKIQLLRESFARNASQPKAISFGKTPPGGWTDADRVAK